MSPTEFAQLAFETEAWCIVHFDAKDARASLRRADTRPPNYPTEPRAWPSDVPDDAYGFVAAKRRELLGRFQIELRPKLRAGRLLVTDLFSNLAHGLAEVDTRGFFNGNDIAPWDSWVTKLDSFLVSWVPNSLITIVERELIQTCPTESFGWVDQYSANLEWQSIWTRVAAELT